MTSLSPKKKLLLGALVVTAVTSITAGSYYSWLITSPPLPKTVDEAIAILSSKRYERLPDYRKNEYLNETHRLMKTLSPKERRQKMEVARSDDSVRQAMRKAWQTILVNRVVSFAKASPEEQTRLLDETIDQIQAWRSGRGKNRPDRGNRPSGNDRESHRGDGNTSSGSNQESRKGDGKRRERWQERFKHRIEQGNPQTAALISEYFRAMRQRREERGMADH